MVWLFFGRKIPRLISIVFFIDAICIWENVPTKWRLTLVYGCPDSKDRRELWNYISSSSSIAQLPWLCLGDFNETLSHDGKEGARKKTLYKMKDFQDFLDRCNFMEVETKGCNFTWSDHREGIAIFMEKLDRIVANWNRYWRELFVSLSPSGTVGPI